VIGPGIERNAAAGQRARSANSQGRLLWGFVGPLSHERAARAGRRWATWSSAHVPCGRACPPVCTGSAWDAGSESGRHLPFETLSRALHERGMSHPSPPATTLPITSCSRTSCADRWSNSSPEPIRCSHSSRTVRQRSDERRATPRCSCPNSLSPGSPRACASCETPNHFAFAEPQTEPEGLRPHPTHIIGFSPRPIQRSARARSRLCLAPSLPESAVFPLRTRAS
jgi:hypothetical protein